MVTQQALTPDDILLGLLVLRPSGSTRRLSGLSEHLHKAVYGLKNNHGDLLSGFKFNQSTVYPYSEQLAGALRGLLWARLMGMENPDFRVYFVKDAAKKAFEKLVEPRLNEGDKARLSAAANEFWQAVAAEGAKTNA